MPEAKQPGLSDMVVRLSETIKELRMDIFFHEEENQGLLRTLINVRKDNTKRGLVMQKQQRRRARDRERLKANYVRRKKMLAVTDELADQLGVARAQVTQSETECMKAYEQLAKAVRQTPKKPFWTPHKLAGAAGVGLGLAMYIVMTWFPTVLGSVMQ